MAWVRTATSLISFGFTIYKFFQGLHDTERIEAAHRLFGPRGFAIVMIGLGVGSLILATIQHRAEMKALTAEYRQYGTPPRSTSLIVALSRRYPGPRGAASRHPAPVGCGTRGAINARRRPTWHLHRIDPDRASPPKREASREINAPATYASDLVEPIAAKAPPARTEHRAVGRLLARARRAAARRQLAPEPGDLLHDLGVAGSPAVDERLHRQEHDRQGRVPADRRDRGARGAHPRRSVALARRRDDDRLLDDRIERSGDARRPRAEVAVAQDAGRPRASLPTGRTWSADRCRSAGTSSRATSTSSCAKCRSGPTASACTPTTSPRYCDENTIGVVPTLGVTFTCAYEPVKQIAAALDALQAAKGLDIPIHVDGASGALHRAVRATGARVGLPDRAREVDQHIGPQVRPRAARRRLGRLARRGGAARGADLPRRLSRRRHADLRAQLQPARRPDRRAVLQLHPLRTRRLSRRPADAASTPRSSWPRGGRDGPVRRCSTTATAACRRSPTR